MIATDERVVGITWTIQKNAENGKKKCKWPGMSAMLCGGNAMVGSVSCSTSWKEILALKPLNECGGSMGPELLKYDK